MHLYGLLAILGTMAILIVQSLCAFAVIAYFHFHKVHPASAHWRDGPCGSGSRRSPRRRTATARSGSPWCRGSPAVRTGAR
ncbi:hypothetical protein C6A85_08510, partial [Mycobacterium sp. ITM-2017-0098]